MIDLGHCPSPHGYLVAGSGFLAGIIQAIPVDAPAVTQIKDLGALGLMGVAVIFLWRELHEQRKASETREAEARKTFEAKLADKEKDIKDTTLMLRNYYQTMADALTAANRAEVDRVSGSLNDIKEILEKMDTVRSAIAKP